MRRVLAIAVMSMAASLAAVPARAFEQTPEPPPIASQVTQTPQTPASTPPVANLQTPSPADTTTAKRGSVFSFGLLPKLNFGLELMYGDRAQSDVQQTGPGFDDNSDVTVLGKVKRSF